jgi:hypothetical protein
LSRLRVSVFIFLLLYYTNFSSTTFYYLLILSSIYFHSKMCLRAALILDSDWFLLEFFYEFLVLGRNFVFLVFKSISLIFYFSHEFMIVNPLFLYFIFLSLFKELKLHEPDIFNPLISYLLARRLFSNYFKFWHKTVESCSYDSKNELSRSILIFITAHSVIAVADPKMTVCSLLTHRYSKINELRMQPLLIEIL